MKEERILQEKINMLEKEVQILTSEIERLNKLISKYEEIVFELKGIKIFLGRVYPEFKNQLPAILRKIQFKG